MRHMHVTGKLFIITSVFLTLFVGGMLLFQSRYFGSYYTKQKQTEFVESFEYAIHSFDGIQASPQYLLLILRTLKVEKHLTAALYPISSVIVPGSDNLKGFYLNIITPDDTSTIDEIFQKIIVGTLASDIPIHSMQILRPGQNELQYITAVDKLVINDEPYLLVAATSLQPVDEAMSTLSKASWIVCMIAVLFSLMLSAIISRLIARPLIREIEQEKKLDTVRREFIANASHELKTPISIISGYSESLLDNLVSGQERTEYEQVIFDEVQKMGKLVRDLLDISMLQNDKMVLHKTEVSLDSLINGTVQRLCGRISEKDIAVSVDVPEGATISADEELLEVVLVNYLSNAIYHTPPSGAIHFSVSLKDRRVRCEVANTGNPIPEDMLTDIWDSFFRVDKAHNREEGRFGLGLSIVKTIIDKHNGDVGAFNTLDGVVFYFELNR